MIFSTRLAVLAVAQLSIVMIVGCKKHVKSSAQVCLAPKHEVYLYATNWSRVDSLAKVIVSIDDSTIINKIAPRNHVSSEKFEKMLRLCEGPHKVHVQFGRYSKDTVITVNNKISLLSSMVYEKNYVDDNGLAIVTLIRDGKNHGAD